MQAAFVNKRKKQKLSKIFMAEYLYNKLTTAASLLINTTINHFKSVSLNNLVLLAKGHINSIHQKFSALPSLKAFCKRLFLTIILLKAKTFFLLLLYISGVK